MDGSFRTNRNDVKPALRRFCCFLLLIFINSTLAVVFAGPLKPGHDTARVIDLNNLTRKKIGAGEYSHALILSDSARLLSEKTGYLKGMADAFNNLGTQAGSRGDYPEAMRYFSTRLQIREEMGAKPEIARSMDIIASLLASQQNYTDAFIMFQKSMKIKEEAGDRVGIAHSLMLTGNLHASAGNMEKALQHHRAALKIGEEIGDHESWARSNHHLGIVNINLGNLSMARQNLDKAMSYAQKTGNKELIKNSYAGYSLLDSAEGNYAKALANYWLSAIFEDSLLNEESNRSTALIRIQYETEKKDREIDLLNKDKALQEEQIAKQRLFRNASLGGTLMLLLLFTTLYRGLQWRKKLERQEAVAVERKRISADLHDEIGSGLSRISLLTEILKKENGDASVEKGAEKIATIAGELSANISEIIWALNTNNDHLENLIAYIRRYAAGYFENSPVQLKIRVPDRIPDIAVSGEQRRNIFYAVKEALHNIVKHAAATEASLEFRYQQGELTVIIHDNGIGIHQEEKNRFGNGLRNLKERMSGISGECIIENRMGTTISLLVPV